MGYYKFLSIFLKNHGFCIFPSKYMCLGLIVLFFVFWKFRPNLRGGNSYHSSFDDPLGKGAAHEADVTTR